MKIKIYLFAFIASMFFLASCTKDEEEQLQSDILGTWVESKPFSNDGVFKNTDKSSGYGSLEYMVISKGTIEFHTHEAEKTDYITFKNEVLDISLSGKWDTENYEYSIHENDLFLAGLWARTFEISSNRMVIKRDDDISVYEKVKEVIAPGTRNAKSISLDKESASIGIGETLELIASISDGTNAAYRNISWSSSDESIAKVSSSGVVTAMKIGTATIAATVCDKSAFCMVTVNLTHNGYEYVDLGLSVKWATMNVGATRPEEYGDYFAWGETKPKSVYTWYYYKYCNRSSDTIDKYRYDNGYIDGFTDNKTVLDPEDDAAYVNWGGSWRMPTKAEQDELRENCTWTWYAVENTEFNGVAGYKVQSKKTGYTDKWIFLPAAGYRKDSRLILVGDYGYYWSSSLYARQSYDACYLYFYPGYVDWDYNSRCYGRSVRPVCP